MTDENVSGDVLHEATNDILQKKIQKINIKSKVSQGIETFPVKKEDFWYDSDKYRDKKQSNKKNALPDKFYCERNSVLTDLFKITHMRTIYNLCMLCFLILFIDAIMHNITELERLYIGIMTIQIAFAKFLSCLYIWSLMQASIIGVYAAFNFWAYQRLEFLPKYLIRKTWDYGWLTIFIVYNFVFIFLSTKTVIDEDLPIACSFIILIEQWRMTMKSYAFVRSVAPRCILSYKAHNETAPPSNCAFSHYIYFLFAPTLLYRDSYPRTKRIRWMMVIKHFAQVGIVIFCQAFIVERFIRPVFNVFGTRDLEQTWYIKSILEASIPSIFIIISMNYLVLHAWMNGWAEMLRFADRLFYKDWWNSSNIGALFPKWNVVVHDWLYKYIHKEMYETIVPGNRLLSIFTVFLISGIVHEYILGFACRFYCPTFFIMFFVFGCSLTLAERYFSSNFFFWIFFWFCTVTISTYAMEYYARFNCAPYPNYYVDLFLPRSWNCQRVEASISN